MRRNLFCLIPCVALLWAGCPKQNDQSKGRVAKPVETAKKAVSDGAEPPDESEEPDPKEDARRNDLPEDTVLALAGFDGALLAQAAPKEDTDPDTSEPETTAPETTADTQPGDSEPDAAESQEDGADSSATPDSEETTQEPPAEAPDAFLEQRAHSQNQEVSHARALPSRKD